MKIIGFLLILTAFITYLVFGGQEIDWEFSSRGLGRARIILILLQLLFGNIYGVAIGVIVGIWMIFKK